MHKDVTKVVHNTLEMEKDFYYGDTYDKLKTPPFVMVKRLERQDSPESGI